LPQHCNNGACWDTYSALLEIPPPKNYPKSQIPASNVLGPLTIDFPGIHRAIDVAVDGLIYDNWKEIEAKTYLNRYCVHDKLVERVLAFAKEANSKYNDPNYKGLSESHHYPSVSQLSYIITMDLFIDVPMHMLSCVAKTSKKMIRQWLKKEGLYAAFLRRRKGRFDTVTNHEVRWCKPYSYENIGAWISNNHFAFARLCPCFFQRHH
jgi:hypothetical protein